MRYVFFGADGRVQSAHNDSTVSKLPIGAVEITADEWEGRFDLRLDGGRLVHDHVFRNPEHEAASIRATRNSLLVKSDWMLSYDSPLSEEQKSRAEAYRQALRDISKQPGFPSEVFWPEYQN